MKECRTVVSCKAGEDYRLFLKFDDGLEGSIDMSHVLAVPGFTYLRAQAVWRRVSCDDALGGVAWPAPVGEKFGVRVDGTLLWAFCREERPAPRPPVEDAAFQRFMIRVLAGTSSRRSDRGAAAPRRRGKS